MPLLTVAVWHMTSQLGILNAYLLPPPVKVLKTAINLADKGIFFKHVISSLQRVLMGFGLSFALAFPGAVLISMLGNLSDYFNPVLEFIRHIPPIACIPILILWLGIEEAPKIAVIVLASFFPIFLNTLNGVLSCDKKLLEVGDVFEFSPSEKFYKIILPSAVPSIIVGMRLGLGYSWRALIGAELIAASSGIGYMIMEAEQLSRPDIIIVGIFTIGILGCAIDYLFFYFTRCVIGKGYLINGRHYN